MKLHGTDRFETVLQNILGLAETARDRLYVQIMKINETEPFLDAYYDFWEKHKIPIILQKQNTFLGRIQDRRYSDLSPLDRIPCWHLQRDLYITADGGVSFCKQDVDGAMLMRESRHRHPLLISGKRKSRTSSGNTKRTIRRT